MIGRHLTDDQLIDRLYGMDPAGDAHLDVCPECASRWETLQEKRGQIVGQVPQGVLWSEQRRQILERVEGGPEPSWNWRRAWAPVLLTSVVLAAGVWIYRPASPPQPSPVAAAVDTVEAGWFEETYSVMQPDEPRAAGPIRVLFEQQEERITE